MKAIWLSAALPLALCQPLLAKSELEMLRERCAEQDRRIQQLEQENGRLLGATLTKQERPVTPLEATASAETRSYVVQKGDTLERISRKTKVSVATLGELNQLKASTVIHPGRRLKLPAATVQPKATAAKAPASPPKEEISSTSGTTPAPAMKTVSTPSSSASTSKIKAEAKSSSKTEAKPAASIESEGKSVIRSITIQTPVVYSDFASKQGTTTDRLNQLNGLSLSNNTLLAVGSELYVPAQP